MGLSNELISQFAKAMTATAKSIKETIVFGTIVDYDGAQYVRIDGSDLLTPMTTTTNVSDGERVTVLIKNHTATVTGNTTSPAARNSDVEGVVVKLEQTAEGIRAEVAKEVEGLSSTITQTASEIRSEVADEVEGLNSTITQTATDIRSEVSDEVEGLNSTITQTASDIRSELSDEVEGLNSTITQTATDIRSEVSAVSTDLDGVESALTTKIEQNATSISTLVSNQDEFSEFQQTVEGFSFMGTGGTVKIQGGDINLTGAITFSDLDDEVKDEIDSAVDTADDALSTANTANSTANSALSTANSASSTASTANYNAGQAIITANSAEEVAEEAKSIAESLDLPDYLHSTYIDSTTIMSPTIVGGSFYAVGQTAWTEMSASGLSVYTSGVSIPKIQLLNEGDDIYLFLGAGTGLADLVGRFMILKTRWYSSIMYYSSTNGLGCGFTFDEDQKITVHGTLQGTIVTS